MKVILTTDIEHVGDCGDIKDVKPGFARNHLFPKKLALRYTTSNVKIWEQKFKVIKEQIDQLRASATENAGKLDGAAVSFEVKAGEEGRLFGSVTSQNIADALGEKGFEVSRKDIVLPSPIKELGTHEVKIRFHKGIFATVAVEVWKEGGEAAQEPETSEEPIAPDEPQASSPPEDPSENPVENPPEITEETEEETIQ